MQEKGRRKNGILGSVEAEREGAAIELARGLYKLA